MTSLMFSKMIISKEWKEWFQKLQSLNDYINGLKKWDDYALKCQNDFDWLLKNEPQKYTLNNVKVSYHTEQRESVLN